MKTVGCSLGRFAVLLLGGGGLLVPLLGAAVACAAVDPDAIPIVTARQQHQGPPLEIEKVDSSERKVVFWLRNHSAKGTEFAVGARHFQIAGKTVRVFTIQIAKDGSGLRWVPELPRLVPGGAHLPNDANYFVTDRAGEWLRFRQHQVSELLRQQKPDGSYHYAGKYQRGHFEDTASGFCAQRAAVLLEFARLTGDRKALAGGLATLDYMKRFRTPRGAQTWEVSLHTPDILAAAHLVAAYVRGYELSGKTEYLDLARKWALSGVPFVYLWGDRPVMVYGTVAVFGATNWTAPNWMGLPVQWCGVMYADALLLLAPHDRSLDWKHLARGILIAGEQMQHPGGPLIGCLPDSFELATQARRGPSINPCALVSLRLAADGQLAGLAVAFSAGHCVVAPYPVSLQDEKIHVRAPKGSRYQVLIDGERVVSVVSKGDDILSLAGGATP